MAICEDRQAERETLREMLEAELAVRGLTGEIVLFSSGEAMLEAMPREIFPMNFLDIYLDRINGQEIARAIRERDGEALDRCLRAIGTEERFVEVTTNRETRKLLLSEIRWAESQDKGCVLRLASESIWIYMRLDGLSALLSDPRFLRCHKSSSSILTIWRM